MEQAYHQDDPKAMLEISRYYYRGEKGLEMNFKLSYQWAKKAAFRDFAPALFDQGYMRYNGIGCKPSKSEGACLLANAASLGSRKAAAYLGELYCLGKDQGGLPRCYERSRYWLERGLTSCNDNFGYPEEDDQDIAQCQHLLRVVEDKLNRIFMESGC